MKRPSDSDNAKRALRDKLIGLGERSIRKSYYPLLHKQLDELEKNRSYLEQKSAALLNMLEDLEEARQELAASQAQYRTLVENINDVIFSVDLDGTVTYVSPTIEEISGRTPEQMVGRHFQETVHPDDRAALADRFEEDLAGRSKPFEFRFLDREGGFRYLRVSGRPVLQEGRVAGITGVLSDVTERKRAEQLRAEAEAKYRCLVEESLVGVYLIQDGRFVYTNDCMARIFGYRQEELVGRPIVESVAPEDRSLVTRNIAKRETGETQSAHYTFRGLRKDGKIIDVEVLGRRIDYNGRPAVIGSLLDITERKRAENTIRALNETLESRLLALTQPVGDVSDIRLSDLINVEELQKIQDAFATATGVASIITDTQGRPITRPSNFCHLCEHIIRRTKKGLINCYCSDAALGRLHPAGPVVQRCLSGQLWDAGTSICVGDRHIANWLIGQVLQEPVDEEAMMAYGREIGADEEEFRQALAKVPRMPLEQFHKVAEALYLIANQLSNLAIQNVQQARFITERKRAEESLRQAKTAAEEANRAKSRFLANISHELRTPMNAVLGMIDLALPREADPVIRECLQTAKGSASLLLTLLSDLLDAARIEAGRLTLEAAPFHLRRLLSETTQALTPRAQAKGIVLTCRVGEDVPEMLLGDQVRLRQVLFNLLGNALKFTERGEVEVDVRLESLDGKSAALAFAVRDTGIGIPAAELASIFEPFSQAEASRRGQYGGAGLGLAISASLVGLMGGNIRVESEPGKGSLFSFTVRLPITAEQVSEGETSGQGAISRKLRLLVAEDNPANQKFVEYILRDRGHVVDFAGDGQEALERVRHAAYDVVLMDIQMPVMDGLEATKAIRAEESVKLRLPIIAVTAYASDEDRARCLATGMDEYLSKPIDGRKLIEVIERLAAGAAQESHGLGADGRANSIRIG